MKKLPRIIKCKVKGGLTVFIVYLFNALRGGYKTQQKNFE